MSYFCLREDGSNWRRTRKRWPISVCWKQFQFILLLLLPLLPSNYDLCMCTSNFVWMYTPLFVRFMWYVKPTILFFYHDPPPSYIFGPFISVVAPSSHIFTQKTLWFFFAENRNIFLVVNQEKIKDALSPHKEMMILIRSICVCNMSWENKRIDNTGPSADIGSPGPDQIKHPYFVLLFFFDALFVFAPWLTISQAKSLKVPRTTNLV